MRTRRHRPSTGPTVVIGAGPHGLTIAIRLLDEGLAEPDDLVIIDPAGRWLDSWRSAFGRLGIEHLRSPVVHHPHPDPYALLNFTREHRRGTELYGRYQAPGTLLFDDFCDEVIDEYELADAVTRGRATGVDPDGTVTWVDEHGRSMHVEAHRVVIASNPSVPAMPDELCGDPTGWRRAPVHAGQVDTNEAVGPGEHVAIVGGGLTAGHLACSAAARGAQVTLLPRRAIVEREFDTDPGWLGPRHLQRYLATPCLESRARLAAEARGGGSMPGWMLGRLTMLERSGALTIRITPADGRAELDEVVAGLDPDHLWCATGWRTSTSTDPLAGALISATGCTTVGELPALGPRLELPDTEVPIHLVGRAATLRLGPTAGNLAGARRAADLIVGHEPDAVA